MLQNQCKEVGKSMTDLEFIASMTTLDEEGQSDDATVLYQGIRNYEQMTVEKVIAKILDTNISQSDPFNTPYTQDEKDLADKIKKWQQKAKESTDPDKPDRFEIMYRKPNGNLSDSIDLRSPIRNYSDAVQEKVKPAQFGEEVKYLGADFVARFTAGGGYK